MKLLVEVFKCLSGNNPPFLNTVFTRIIPQGYYSKRRAKTGALFEAGALFKVGYYFQPFFKIIQNLKIYTGKLKKTEKYPKFPTN